MPITTPSDPALFLDDGGSAATATGYGQVSGSPRIMDLGATATDFNGVLVINVDAIDVSSGDETYFVSVEGSDSSSFTGTPQTLQSVEVSVTGQVVLPLSAILLGHFYRYLRLKKTIGGTTPSLTVTVWTASYSDLPDLTLAELIAINGVAGANLQQLSASLLAWASGTPTGGPGGDGRYPLNDAAGNSFLVDCPAKLGIAGLLAENNLSDLADAAAARDNLDVYAKAEVYTKTEADAGFVANLGGVAGLQEGPHGGRPAAGTAGRIYIETDTARIYRDDGTAWVLISTGSGGGPVWFGTTPPIDTDLFPLWWNNDAASDAGGALYVFYNDGDTGQWVSAAAAIAGPKGDQGDQGDPGVGVQGPAGPTPWQPVAPWATATSYIADPPADVVTQGGSSYVCIVTHTSGTFATDLAAGKWLLIAGLSPGGSSGQIQYNNAGVLGGFTLSGDATLNPSSGVITIASNAITSGKFRQSGALSIVANATNATANVADLSAPAGSNQILRERSNALVWGTLSVLLDEVFSNAQGAILYRGASTWGALGPGTAGYLLQTNGASANPSWVAAPSGGGGGSGGTWLPLVTGSYTPAYGTAQPTFITDGAGRLITVAYAP